MSASTLVCWEPAKWDRTQETFHVHLLFKASLFFLDALENIISDDLAEPARLLQPHPLDKLTQNLEIDLGQQG